MNWVEILGYAASVLVALSLTMRSLARLRALNLVGSVAFACYGWLLGAFPVLIVNGYIAVINIIFLLKMQPGRSEAFELLAIDNPGNRYLRRFLDFHADDICRFFPSFDLEGINDVQVVFILRDMLPVGLVICRRTDGETLTVILDYVIPSHRDFRCAEYFYRSWHTVMDHSGIGRFMVRSDVDAHLKYLRRLGFVPDENEGPGWYVRTA